MFYLTVKKHTIDYISFFFVAVEIIRKYIASLESALYRRIPSETRKFFINFYVWQFTMRDLLLHGF